MGNEVMGRVVTEATVENLRDLWDVERGFLTADKVRRVVLTNALANTGATILSLPARVIQQLGLNKSCEKRVTSSIGVSNVWVYDAVRLTIQGRCMTADVAEVPDDVPPLIGQISLVMLDFVVDTRSCRLLGNPAHGGEHMFEMYCSPAGLPQCPGVRRDLMELATHYLTERRPTECRLTSDDVDFLLAAHRAHLRLLPTRRPDHYRLTPTGHVGTLVAPHCRLLIRPKLPLHNLFYLLDAAAEVPSVEDRTTAVAGAELLDLLAVHLARLLAERAARGLHRGYVERGVQGPFLQGALDLAAQLRAAPTRKDRVHSRHEDFTLDVPCNQVPKAAAELVLRSPLLAEEARAAVRRSLAGFVEVSAVPLGPASFTAATTDRLTEAYRPLLDLCRLLAESLSPGETAGASACPAFLLDMERVFESYCTRHCVAAWDGKDGWSVSVQPLLRPHEPVAGQPDVSMRPDLTLDRDGCPLLVVDAKWKRLPPGALVTSDLYQVLAYCTALGVERAALVYPGRRDRTWRYRFRRSPLAVAVHTLRVVGNREACLRSARRWAAALPRGLA